jgi:ADP-dependent NAD(P)H-hydrate dehydratase
MSAAAEPVTPAVLRDWPLPQPGESKHSRGHVLVAGGSPSTPGGALLAGLAALRVGAGVLRLAVARSVAAMVAVTVPEAAVVGLSALEEGSGSSDELAARLDDVEAALVGPGLDNPEAARYQVRAVVEHAPHEARVVLDAYALGVLADLDERAELRGRLVLTPNRPEAERLLPKLSDDKVAVAREIADRYGAAVSYENTLADADGGCWTIPTGHAGLGTSGSGDVLAGAVAGLLARGAEPAQAVCWATYLHTAAGDRLAPRVGRLGFLARELVDEMPRILTELEA